MVDSTVGADVSVYRASISEGLLLRSVEVRQSIYASGQETVLGACSIVDTRVLRDVDLSASVVPGGVLLRGTQIGQRLLLEGAKDEDRGSFQRVQLMDVEVGGGLSLCQASLAEDLVLRGVDVGHDLYINGAESSFQAATLQDVKVGRDLLVNDGTFAGQLTLRSVVIGQNLHGARVKAAGGYLWSIDIKGDLSLRGGQLSEKMLLQSVQVGQNLLLDGAESAFGPMDVVDVTVGRDALLSGATVSGDLVLRNVRVQQDLVAQAGTQLERLKLMDVRVGGDIDLSNASIRGPLEMQTVDVGQNIHVIGSNSFLASVGLLDVKTGRDLLFSNCTVAGDAHVQSVVVGQSLGLNGADASFQSVSVQTSKIGQNTLFYGARFEQIALWGVTTGGNLALGDARVAGTLEVQNVEVGQNAYLSGANARFGAVMVSDAKVARDVWLSQAEVGRAELRSVHAGGTLAFDGTTLEGPLTMDSLRLGHDLTLKADGAFQEITLAGSSVEGELVVEGVTVGGPLHISATAVHQEASLRRSTFAAPVSLVFSQLHTLDLSHAQLAGLDLSGTRMAAELRLGSGPGSAPAWGAGAVLELRNAHAGTLEDDWTPASDAWPAEVALDGFTYDRLGGGTQAARDTVKDRPVKWYVRWLGRDPTQVAQPYEQLAAVLRAAGEPVKADAVRYANRERARRASWRGVLPGMRWFGLQALRATIGYGIGLRYFRALFWVALATIAGWWVFERVGEGPGGWENALYSFDLLLPIVAIRSYDAVDHSPLMKAYVLGHQLVGWLLGSFLIAGLAGFTQK